MKHAKVWLVSGKELDITYEESNIEEMFRMLADPKYAINFNHKTLLYVSQIAAIEWID